MVSIITVNANFQFFRKKITVIIAGTRKCVRICSIFYHLDLREIHTLYFEENADFKYCTIETKVSTVAITKKTKPMSLFERLERLNQVCRGWMNNYRLTNIYAKVKKLDEWLRNRLRYCIWHDWKKLERKRKNLIRLGIEYGQAYAWSRTRMGGWAVAQSPILKTTITKSILKRRGYKPLLDYINNTQTSIW